jgi:hypothetical protein
MTLSIIFNTQHIHIESYCAACRYAECRVLNLKKYYAEYRLLSVNMLSVNKLSVNMLSVNMLSVNMLIVVRLNVIMLSVVAPYP